MSETILKEWCPKCETVNFINLGDMEDMTVSEPDGVECHKCGHQWLFDEDSVNVVGLENLDYEIGGTEA